MTSRDRLSVDRFSIIQMCNNSEGKTSGMLTMCTLGCFSSILCFSASFLILFGASIYGVIMKEPLIELLPKDIIDLLNSMMQQSIMFFGLAGAGLGVRRFTTDKHVLTDMDSTTSFSTSKTETSSSESKTTNSVN